MYQIISALNSIIREETMPNPFESMFNNKLVAILFFSIFGGKLLKEMSYRMCGVFYKSRSNKVLGSIGYMFFYCINVQVLIKLNQWFQNINLIISLYIVFIVVMFIILYKGKRIIKQNIT